MKKRLTILAAALMLAACVQSEQTTPAEREQIRMLQAKRDIYQATLQIVVNKLNAQYQATPEYRTAAEMEKQIADAKAALAKKCGANEALELDPGKPEMYLHCVTKPTSK